MEVREVEVQAVPKVTMEWPNNTNLSQLITIMQYVILDDNYQTMHKPFHCKDYFNEIIATELDGKKRRQYGFKSEKLPFNLLETTTFKLALIFKSGNIEQYIKGFNLLIPKIDSNRGFITTTIELTEDKKVLVLNVDTNWLKVPAYMGFYMLMLRLAYNYEGQDFNQFIKSDFKGKTDKINTNEFMSYNGHQDKMIYLYEGGELLQKWEDYLKKDNSTLHNDSGFITYIGIKYNNDINLIIEDVKNSKKTDLV